MGPGELLPGKKHIYRMGMEDFYVHSLLHFRKHFTGSGVGIRFLADIYVFRQQRLPWMPPASAASWKRCT